MCLHAMKEKMKDETNGNGKMGSSRVCDPISNISVTHVGDRRPIPETSSSEEMILQGNNEEKRLRICDDYDDSGDYYKKNIGDSSSEEPMQMAGITCISRTGIPGKLLNGLKCTAKLKPTVHKRKSDSAPRKDQDSEKWENGKGLTAAIRLTVEGLLQKQIEIRSKSSHDNTLLTVERIIDGKPKRLLTKSDFVQTQHLLESSELGSELLVSPDTISFPGTNGNKISVTMALPCDDAAIANLRLSVFSDFSEDLRKKFCQRSCEVLNRRRQNGATCLVARGSAQPHRDDNERIIGSVECSTHEFTNTELGRRRPVGTIMYVTEVAVSPKSRRSGVGTVLLKAIDELAKNKKMETVYLHVDVENAAACELYKKAGYEILDSTNCTYSEFTTALNLQDGATKGRKHFLLQKTVTDCQNWLPPSAKGAKLGFQLPQ